MLLFILIVNGYLATLATVSFGATKLQRAHNNTMKLL
jgi:hypothetical protein